jgi:hypothetical protein
LFQSNEPQRSSCDGPGGIFGRRLSSGAVPRSLPRHEHNGKLHHQQSKYALTRSRARSQIALWVRALESINNRLSDTDDSLKTVKPQINASNASMT